MRRLASLVMSTLSVAFAAVLANGQIASKIRHTAAVHLLQLPGQPQALLCFTLLTLFISFGKLLIMKPNTKYYYQTQCSNVTAPYEFVTSRGTGDHTPFTAALVVDMGTMGPLGLSTHVGKGAENPLKPGEKNTIDSLKNTLSGFDFLWHREYPSLAGME